MKRLRVYADTSVFGGCLDAEFAEASRAFFMEVAAGRFLLVIPDETVRELAEAPLAVRRVLEEVSPDDVEFVPDSDEIRQLRDAYLHAGVVGPACTEDAEHIAASSVAEVDLVISWNFKQLAIHLTHVGAANNLVGWAVLPAAGSHAGLKPTRQSACKPGGSPHETSTRLT